VHPVFRLEPEQLKQGQAPDSNTCQIFFEVWRVSWGGLLRSGNQTIWVQVFSWYA